MKIAVKTGGNIKFDLKTFDEKLNIAPCCVSYEEIEEISKFIRSINKNIPYSLLVFYGEFQMKNDQ